MTEISDSPYRLRETIAAYDACAATYAARYSSVDLTQKLVQFLATLPFGHGPVLDAGCGPGRDTAALAARGIFAIGLDRSRSMLQVARQAASGAPFVQADMRALPLRTASIAGIWQCASLVHLSPAEAMSALVEARRVLVPGGTIFMSVAYGHGSEWRTTNDAFRRWFQYYEPNTLSELLTAARLTISSLDVEPGVAHGRWINVLARRG